MKKTILFVAALFAAVMVNAKEISVDLSKATEMSYDNCSAALSYADDVLTVNYSTSTGWEWAGIEVALDNLDVTAMAFDFQGSASVWTSFHIYLRDSEGARWYDDADDFSLSSDEWVSKVGYVPTKLLWDASSVNFGDKPIIAVGFIANPMEAYSGTFKLRNVKLTVSGETAVENVESQTKAVKVVRNGQILILRDGKTFNALGAEVK